LHSRQTFSAIAIHEQFVTVFGLNAIAYLTIMKYLREAKWASGKEKSIEPRSSKTVDSAILTVHEEQSFPSVREFAKRIYILPSTVHRRLNDSIGFVVKLLFECRIGWTMSN
jgi:hypothetical protein